MNRSQRWPIIVCFLVAIAIAIAIAWIFHYNHQPHQPPDHHPKKPTAHKIVWGVDTANRVSNSFYKCVVNHYGSPKIWGRYMDSKANTSTGLTQKEISFIHGKNGKILLIFNHFHKATGYQNGEEAAHSAISKAKKLGAPKGVAIFADVEPTYSVDASFIKGWVKTLSQSPYKAGIYGDFTKNSDLNKAYQAAQNNLHTQPILWSNRPVRGITSAKKAPDFQPSAPKKAKTWVWQYGVNANQCNIDTDLAKSEILKYLW